MRPAHGPLRLLRTAFLAAACTGLAWGGHNAWAEVPAGAVGFLAATAVLLALLLPFTRRMRSFGDIFAVMAAAQVAAHLVLQGSTAHLPASGHGGHDLSAHMTGLAPGMLLAHLWAALLASALLAHGEAALWLLAGLLARALPPLRARVLRLRPSSGRPVAPLPAPPSRTAPRTCPARAPPRMPHHSTQEPGPRPGTSRTREKRRMTHALRRRAAAALPALLAAALLALAPSPALAHDTLTGSDPEDGATLDAVPEEIVLTFNNAPMEAGSGSAVVVTGPDGETTYEEGELTYEGTDVSVGLRPLDQAGEYTIGFRVVSSDGHPIQDSLVFTVTEEAVAAAAPEETEAPAPDEAAEEVPEEEPAPAEEEAQAAEDEGGVPTALIVVVAVGVIAVAAVAVVALRMRGRSQE